jgi:hypothetical protein
MYQSGKAAQIAKEMHKYKIEVMRLSETRWISTGKDFTVKVSFP